MKIAVRYYTRSGNTKKVAEAVAEALSLEAKDVSNDLTEKVDILFLGCSYYAFDIDDAVKSFIEKNKDYIGKIACVGTSAMRKSMKKPVRKVAEKLGIEIATEEFHCRGSFGILHKSRPNEQDLLEAMEFAKRIAES